MSDASMEFEWMVNRPTLEKAENEASYSFELCRYDFAVKVAKEEEITLTDGFEYLTKWADYCLAFSDRTRIPLPDTTQLLQDLQGGKLTDQVRSVFQDQVDIVREKIKIATEMQSRLADPAFRDALATDILPSKVVTGIYDSANEIPWLPFELKGLEKCVEIASSKST